MNPAFGFALALAAGLIWSVGNIIHKILASRLVRSTPLMVAVFSLVSVLVGGVLLIWFPLVSSAAAWVWAVAGGVCYVLAVWAYLSAMRTEEASRIVPLFSIGSVLIVILSAILLGEVFSVITYIGIGLVLVGAVLISITTTARSLFSSQLLRYMFLSGLFFAGHALIVKYLLGFYSYGTVFASLAMVQGLMGLGIVIIARRQIRQTLRQVTVKAIGLNIVTDIVGFGAELLYTFALTVWYLALVETIASLQYLFIFLWGLVLSRWFPQILRESLTRAVVVRKAVAVTIIIIGIYLIS
ncbi:MAG: EamA family transporter [Patescibacteria group bacterium]